MAARFYYQNLARSESTDAFLRSELLGVAERSFSDGRYFLHVRVTGPDSVKIGSGQPYTCELSLDLPNEEPLLMKRQGSELTQTVRNLGEALRISVQKRTGGTNMEINALKSNQNRDVILTNRIQERIRWDRRISNSDVHVLSKGGKVTLIGVVDSQFKRVAATEIATATKGVTSVTNNLQVPTAFTREDTEIKGLIENRVSQLNLYEKEYVTVQVDRGRVKLEGVVFTKDKKASVAGIAWALSGVKDCLNFVEISGDGKPSVAVSTQKSPSLVLETNTHESFGVTALAL